MKVKKFNLNIEMQFVEKRKIFYKIQQEYQRNQNLMRLTIILPQIQMEKKKTSFEREYKLKQLKHVIKYLYKSKPGKILDVGCGQDGYFPA